MKLLVPKLVEGLLSAGLFLFAFTSLSISQPLFAPPVNLGPKINTSAFEGDPFWDEPRKRLYFMRDGYLWSADWTGTDWTNPVPLGPQINAGAAIKQSPSVTPDGQKLYYVDDSR